MDAPSLLDELERFRNGYFKLRNVVHDRTTDLPAYPVLVDALRTLLDHRPHVGVIHVEAVNLGLLESTYGWQVLDRVLSRIGGALRDAVGRELPAETLVAVNAVPGDRFIAFVPSGPDGNDCDPDWLAGVARHLRARLEAAFAEDEDLAAVWPALGFEAGHALLSENPFYRFERRVHAAVEDARTLHERRDRRRERLWGSELRRIIREASIDTVFQPVVDLESRSIVGYEALSRGPERSRFESPRALFAMSDRFGSAPDLDRVCRAAALRRSAAGAMEGKLFLNVLPACLHDPDWSRGAVERLLEPSGRGATDVVVEISERAAEADLDRTVEACQGLRALGFGLALDDAGTGYASLVTVERVRPDYVKVDPSLVRGIDGSLLAQEVFQSLSRVGARVGAAVVAVGVEREEEAICLHGAGASLGQGFLFAGPAPVEAWARRARGGGEA